MYTQLHISRIPVAAPAKAWVCGCSLARIKGSDLAGSKDLSCERCVLSGGVLCDGLFIRQEKSYQVWRV